METRNVTAVMHMLILRPIPEAKLFVRMFVSDVWVCSVRGYTGQVFFAVWGIFVKFSTKVLELTIVEIAHRVISNILICFILLFSFFSWNLLYYTWINGQNLRLFKEYLRFLRTFSFVKDFQVPLKWLFEFQHFPRSSRIFFEYCITLILCYNLRY